MKYIQMKPVMLSIAVYILICGGLTNAQATSEMVNKAEELESKNSHVPCNNDTVPGVRVRADTVLITLGNRQIRIIEKNGDTDIDILEKKDVEENNRSGNQSVRHPFKGNWRGLELGLNNYVNGDFSTSLGPEAGFMELRTGKSLNLNLNVLQYDFALSGNNIGMVTGLGLEFNNYRFTNNVSITKEDGVIVPVYYDDADISVNRSRLRTTYLTVPLLLEFQTNNPRHSRRVYFSAGVIGGLNIGSHTKIVYRDNSGKKRDKVKDDFYLSPFRYGISVRAGYRSLNLFANYYPVALFQENKGPELYPVSIGFSILGF